MIRPGQQRHRVLIQTPEKEKDGLGGYTEIYNTITVRQAAIWVNKGKETVIGGRIAEEAIWNIRIRYYDGLKSNMRFVLENTNEIFEILSISPSEMRRIYQDVSCKKVD